MLNVAAYKSGLVVIGLSLMLASCASTKTQADARASADAADATLKRFIHDPDMNWLQQNLPKARALMICPQILQAGFVFGGAGGTCVVMSRGQTDGGWNGPAFYKMAIGSVGLQAGAQSSEMVALIMTDKARDSLLSSSFKLGGDVSVAAGPVGTGAGSQINADMVNFVKSKGLYGGLNVDGSVISVDDGGNASYYGRPATPVDILVKKSVTDPTGSALARTAAGQ